MNKLLILDLDGTLIESRDIHFYALNDALAEVGPQFVIGRDEHLSTYDGLNTTKKLEMLSATKGLDRKYFDQVWHDKQQATFKHLRRLERSPTAIRVVEMAKQRGWKVAVASNSIRETIRIALNAIGILADVDYIVSNEDVKRTKPFPEMYWQCMTAMNALPSSTLIVEDSHIGRKGAIDSGANLLAIENSMDLTIDKVMNKMNEIESKSDAVKVPWRDSKLNVLIPMAGAGSRFAQAGYTFPKPLIEVHGKPMIQVVVDNLNMEANYIFIVQQEHYDKYNLKYVLNLIAPNCKIVCVSGLTEGAACTTLLAREHIDNDNPLVIANSDQFIEWDSNEVMYSFSADEIDGGILTFESSHPKWSYARLHQTLGYVVEVAEKKVISNHATVGVYYWKHGSDYVKYADQMIEKNIRVNNEFYVCPVFNEAIQDGKKIKSKDIRKMWGIGTPEDLNYFLDNYK